MVNISQIKLLNRKFRVVSSDNTFTLYTLNMTPIMSYKVVPTGSCSVTTLYGFNFRPYYVGYVDATHKGKYKKYMIEFLRQQYLSNKSFITFQNTTKTECFEMLKEVGFKDLYRLRGQYISSDYKGPETNSKVVVSVMMYNKKDNFYNDAIKKTKELLLANGENL